MESSTSSLPPPSPHQPPTTTPSSPLEQLIPHLLASKRSLSSVTHVYRANELCTSTRLALEHSAITTARTSFLRSGIVSQLAVLQHVQQNTGDTAAQGKDEFEAVVRDLDAADARLRATLEKLRGTVVEAGLRPLGEERRSLLDFVDEGGVEGLVGVIKGVIDGAGEGLAEFVDGNRGFEAEVREVRRILGGESEGRRIGEKRSPIPDILHEMEDRAKDMAVSLESLVGHYDLCVTAIKHTEGGGDAALKIAGDLPDGVDIGEDIVGGPPKPITEEERSGMMAVLKNDAAQVEAEVMEIRDHISEMEALHEHVDSHTDGLAKEHASTNAAFRLLEGIGRKLPSYITQSQVFLLHRDSEKAKIDERLEELEGLTEFYDGFLRAYDNLLIEIGRRKTMEIKMEKEVQAARERLERLCEDDLEEREAFRKEQGDFLPVDIWPGLMSGPLRFDISAIDEEVTRVPDISKSVIHRAIRRVHGER